MIAMTHNLPYNLPLLAILLLSTIVLPACGDDLPEQDATTADQGPTRLDIDEPSSGFAEKIPEDDQFFEEAVAMQHTHLMAQVSADRLDSVMKANLFSAGDPREGKRRAERELKKLMRRQDTLARRALANQFNLPADTIEAILERQGWRGRR